jgi:hypothetical protein
MILSHGAFFVNMIVKEFVKFAYDWFSQSLPHVFRSNGSPAIAPSLLILVPEFVCVE